MLRAFVFILATGSWLATPSAAATKIFLRDAASALTPPGNFYFKLANTTQGTSKVSNTVASVAGPLSGHYWPTVATHYIFEANNGWKMVWFTAPLTSGITISGTITPNLWGLESATQCNCGARYEVLRWDASQGGIGSSLGISTDNGLTEWGTTAAARTSPTLTPSSTTFNTGDRIVIVIYNDDGNGVTEASGRTWTLDYGAATGVDGDSYLSFTETIGMASDMNNARPLPSLALLRSPLAWWKEFFDQVFG